MEPALFPADAPVAPELRQRFLHSVVRVAAAQMEEMAESEVELWCERAVGVLSANLERGRFKPTGQSAPGARTLLSYTRQVLTGLLADWDLVERLREGEVAAWEAVRGRFERLAYHQLGPSGRQEWAAWESRTVASKACADLWQWLQTHSFPFDVPFELWAARVLVNRLHEAHRKRSTFSHYEVDSLDRPLFEQEATLGEMIPDYSFDRWLASAENRELLLQALAELDERGATVLRLWYLEGWSGDEIAARLGLNLNNVYVIRFRALEKLRKLLLQDERFGLAEALQRVEANKRRFPPDVASQESEAPDG